MIAKGGIIDAEAWNSGKRRWALPGSLDPWMPVMLFRAAGHFVLRAFWQSLPRPAVRLFGMKANQNNPAGRFQFCEIHVKRD